LTLVGGAALGVVYLAVERLFDREERLIARIRALPATEIRDVPDGARVKIVGEVVAAGSSVLTPLGQRECIFYSVRIDQLSGAARLVQSSGVDFQVRDASGTALVRLRDASPLIERNWRCELDAAQLAKLDARLAHDDFGHFLGSEGAILVGARVAVVGVARWEIDRQGAGAGYRDPPRRLVLAAANGRPLHISADPRLLGSA
jgi:hypothetical protein